jgi:hypothetical protein
MLQRLMQNSLSLTAHIKFAFLFQDDDEHSPKSLRRRSTNCRPSARGSLSGSFRKDGSLKNSFTTEDYRATLRRSITKKHMRQTSLLSVTSNVSTASVFTVYSPIIFILTIAYYVGNSISKLQIQVATNVFELSAGNCHR